MATINPTINTSFVNLNRAVDTAATTRTSAQTTGFGALSSFGTQATNFANRLGAPDAAGSGLQQLNQVIEALGKIVEALGTLVKALQGGGAEAAKGQPPAGGAEATPTKPAETKPAEGGGGAEEAKKTEGGGGAEQAKGGGMEILAQLTQLVQSLMTILQALIEQQEGGEAKKGKGKKEGAGAGGGPGGNQAANASDRAKENASPNSAVGRAAAMERLNQALTQILSTLLQVVGQLVQQIAQKYGGSNPEVAAAAGQAADVLQATGGGGLRGGVIL